MSVQKRSIDSVQEQWDAAIQSIRSLPVYNGLILTPQLGLIPLQQNPTSGLWEFAHLQSGELPKIVDGQYILTDDTGIILTLLPGSAFWMGANKTGTHNVDPRAKETEGPVHQVELAPFFMSKYEMTQGQWLRMNEQNPAAYPIGTELNPSQSPHCTPSNKSHGRKLAPLYIDTISNSPRKPNGSMPHGVYEQPPIQLQLPTQCSDG